MRRATTSAVGTWCLAVTLAGCSAIATFDGLVGANPGGVSGGGDEGGVSSSDGSTTPQPDSSSPLDDASTGGDADGGNRGPPFCAMSSNPAVLLCEDFETSTLDPARWQAPGGKGPGTIACSSDTAVSSLVSLKSNTKQHAGGNSYQVVESTDISLSAASSATFRLELEWNVTMDVANTADGVDATMLDIGTDNGGDLWISFDKTSMWAGTNTWEIDGGAEVDYDSDLGMALPQNGWHAMQIDVTFGQSNGFIVSIDGKKVGGGTGLRGVTAPPSLVHLYLGIDNNGRFGDTKAYFDNVRITKLPTPVP